MSDLTSHKKTKVLVAEDNPVVSKGLKEFLLKWGYDPVESDNGNSAWEILENDHSVKLAIVDWNLPGISGMQLCQRLRTRMTGPYVYTIMFSARNSHEEKILALDGGADDYLVKPCKPSELRARLGVGQRIIYAALKSSSTPASHLEPETDTETKKLPK